MKFLVDVCAASGPLLTTLAKLGHDVRSAQDHCPDALYGTSATFCFPVLVFDIKRCGNRSIECANDLEVPCATAGWLATVASSDQALLALAREEGRVLITEDKD